MDRDVDPHLFFADPDPAAFLNADPDPAAFQKRIWIQLKLICKKLPYEEFSLVEKNIRLLKNKKQWSIMNRYGSMRIRIHSPVDGSVRRLEKSEVIVVALPYV